MNFFTPCSVGLPEISYISCRSSSCSLALQLAIWGMKLCRTLRALSAFACLKDLSGLNFCSFLISWEWKKNLSVS